MISLYVTGITYEFAEMEIGYETNQDRIKSNMSKTMSRNMYLAIFEEVKKSPNGMHTIYPFKQYLVRLDAYMNGNPWKMFFYNCDNDIDKALNIYSAFPEWGGITKQSFMENFQEMQLNYDSADLAVLIEVA